MPIWIGAPPLGDFREGRQQKPTEKVSVKWSIADNTLKVKLLPAICVKDFSPFRLTQKMSNKKASQSGLEGLF
jgi:hypothetical protein